jgi:hypothetical protein
MRDLKESNSERQKIERWLSGAEGGRDGELWLNRDEVSGLQDEKSFEVCLHNNVNVLNTTEWYT